MYKPVVMDTFVQPKNGSLNYYPTDCSVGYQLIEWGIKPKILTI